MTSLSPKFKSYLTSADSDGRPIWLRQYSASLSVTGEDHGVIGYIGLRGRKIKIENIQQKTHLLGRGLIIKKTFIRTHLDIF